MTIIPHNITATITIPIRILLTWILIIIKKWKTFITAAIIVEMSAVAHWKGVCQICQGGESKEQLHLKRMPWEIMIMRKLNLWIHLCNMIVRDINSMLR